MMRDAYDRLQNRDRWSTEGENIGGRLRAIKSKEIRLRTAKAINDLLFDAEMKDEGIYDEQYEYLVDE